jgi:hypothetical protein
MPTMPSGNHESFKKQNPKTQESEVQHPAFLQNPILYQDQFRLFLRSIRILHGRLSLWGDEQRGHCLRPSKFRSRGQSSPTRDSQVFEEVVPSARCLAAAIAARRVTDSVVTDSVPPAVVVGRERQSRAVQLFAQRFQTACYESQSIILLQLSCVGSLIAYSQIFDFVPLLAGDRSNLRGPKICLSRAFGRSNACVSARYLRDSQESDDSLHSGTCFDWYRHFRCSLPLRTIMHRLG